MPAQSIAQQRLMQMAEHHPEQVSAKNRGVLKMSHQQLHDFAAGSEKGKPAHVREKTSPADRRAAHKADRAQVHAHAAYHGHGGAHAEAYVDGAMAQRQGAHHGNMRQPGYERAASAHGWSSHHAAAYAQGAEHEAAGMHASSPGGAVDA